MLTWWCWVLLGGNKSSFDNLTSATGRVECMVIINPIRTTHGNNLVTCTGRTASSTNRDVTGLCEIFKMFMEYSKCLNQGMFRI
jgi:hypothetical protein